MSEITCHPGNTSSGSVRPCLWPAVSPAPYLDGLDGACNPSPVKRSPTTITRLRSRDKGRDSGRGRGFDRNPNPVLMG